MDYSKAFDTLNHRLFLAKTKAYTAPLKLKQNYLTGSYKRTKVNNGYSSWSEIIERVPQRSILEPLLSDIFLKSLFIYTKDMFYK